MRKTKLDIISYIVILTATLFFVGAITWYVPGSEPEPIPEPLVRFEEMQTCLAAVSDLNISRYSEDYVALQGTMPGKGSSFFTRARCTKWSKKQCYIVTSDDKREIPCSPK